MYVYVMFVLTFLKVLCWDNNLCLWSFACFSNVFCHSNRENCLLKNIYCAVKI